MSDELIVVSSQVPAKIEELVQFVKYGRERLTAVRAEIRAIEKLGLEDERRKKALEEAQALSEQLLDAEVSLGEIMATLPEAPGKRTDLQTLEDTDVQMSKKEILKEAGFSVKTAQRYEMLASHPEIVAQMKAEARDKGAVVSRTAVLRAINIVVNPPVDEDEEETYIEVLWNAQEVMGKIDLDPAAAPENPKDPYYYQLKSLIDKKYRKEDDGLSQPWEGNVYLFPPKSMVSEFVDKLIENLDTVPQAIVRVPNDVSAVWFGKLLEVADAVVFDANPSRTQNKEKAWIYIGCNANKFLKLFVKSGWGFAIDKVIFSDKDVPMAKAKGKRNYDIKKPSVFTKDYKSQTMAELMNRPMTEADKEIVKQSMELENSQKNK